MTSDSQIRMQRDLREVVELSTQLLTQAINDADATIDGTSLPGGRAMIALAHVGDAATFERRVELIDAAWVSAGRSTMSEFGAPVRLDGDHHRRPDPAADEDDDTAPALQLLRYWSEQYRWELGMVWDHIPTINTEAKFLSTPDVIAHVMAHHAGDWDHLCRDANRARLHLESILHAGRRPDRTRVVCDNPTCPDPRQLILVYGRRYVTGYTCTVCTTPIPTAYECDTCHRITEPGSETRCTREYGKKDDRKRCKGHVAPITDPDHCPNPWCFTVAPPEPTWASNTAEDRWKCTSCKTHYDEDRLRRAHATQLRHEKSERYVLLPEAIATLVAQGRPERTIRSWLDTPVTEIDVCARCRKHWPHRERAACPRKLKVRGTDEYSGEECGGELRTVKVGDREAVVQSWCDLATRKVWVWWPDLWRIHNATKIRKRKSAS